MKLFPQLMKLLSAALAGFALVVGTKLVALFQGPAPSDVSPMVWGLVGFVAVFLINFLVGKIPQP